MVTASGYHLAILSFNATQRPSWRSADLPDTADMLQDIIASIKYCRNLSNPCIKLLECIYVLESDAKEMVGLRDEQATFDVLQSFMSGLSHEELDLKKQTETLNTFHALKHMFSMQEEMQQQILEEMQQTGQDDMQDGRLVRDQILLTMDMLMEVHAKLLKGLHHDAGKLRNSATGTHTDSGWYSYLSPEFVPSAMQCFIDQHNYMVANKLHGDVATIAPVLFNLAAQAQLQFLTIHPFVDGNGRLGRLLVNYILQPLLPFPVRMTPPYVSREQYVQAISLSRLSNGCLTSPSDLAAMIIEGAWFSLKDARNIQDAMAPKSRGQIFVSDITTAIARYSLLHDIGLTDDEKLEEQALVRVAAEQLLTSPSSLICEVELLRDTSCMLTRES
eukprot:55400-Chlamydomonas_euryale.AAC.4